MKKYILVLALTVASSMGLAQSVGINQIVKEYSSRDGNQVLLTTDGENSYVYLTSDAIFESFHGNAVQVKPFSATAIESNSNMSEKFDLDITAEQISNLSCPQGSKVTLESWYEVDMGPKTTLSILCRESKTKVVSYDLHIRN